MNYKYKIYILIASILIFSFAFYFFGIKNLFSVLESNASVIYEKRLELENVGFRKLMKDILEKNLIDTEADRVFLEKFFLKDKNYVNFIIFLEKSVNDQAVKYFDINPAMKNNEEILFSVSVYDNFSKIMRFISFLENTDYLINIQSVNLSVIKGTGVNKEKFPLVSAGDVNAVINFKLGL